ncbi:hypothetical protein OIDMADRAFT_172496 [Oidiodendron maius Zn]|uniref:Aminotransferase class I/classII large domain-containing protein n=1 Tax=Oidiodendron maius (strain Zn) TaxID=913774 RepID=A0A0C3GF68_OIDMZ|nr:hypothetical protein OIDMADRAFT_172496 [Oidiodendron maius Zn]
MARTELPVSIDLSHHINALSKSRHPSPLKDIIKYMAYDGMISFAGGLPHSSLFPFQTASIGVYPASTVLDPINPQAPEKLDIVNFSKAELDGQALSIATAMQYGSCAGDPSVIKWAADFTNIVFQPAYSDFEILLSGGNTDAWKKVVGLLSEQGDKILVEAHTYPSSQALWIPMGCEAVPVKVDSHGMRSDDMDAILTSWEANNPGVKKPHLLYIVPVGSNPTGSTMLAQRKKEIYDACVKHDVIICEDDPYFFLQYPEYDSGFAATPGSNASTPEEYLKSLAPSFLKYDFEGRVIRLDTFSKTLSPGNRLGYFVANPVFIERLLRATEVETQAPSGWSQLVVSNLLHNWGTNGYITWLANLRDQYRTRRDYMAIFSFVPPSAGMFIWARFYLTNSPRFLKIQDSGKSVDPEQEFLDYVWAELSKALVLLTPGSYYTPWQGKDKALTKTRGSEPGVGYFRLAFSMPTREEIYMGVNRMAKVLQDCWE